jgi:hypothetical protein
MGQWSDSEEDNAERDASGKESAHSTEQNQRSIRSSVGRLRSLLHEYLLPRRLASLSSNSLRHLLKERIKRRFRLGVFVDDEIKITGDSPRARDGGAQGPQLVKEGTLWAIWNCRNDISLTMHLVLNFCRLFTRRFTRTTYGPIFKSRTSGCIQILDALV